jgi:hypothetical protein
MSGLKKHSVRRKHKLHFEFDFSCPTLTRFIIVVLVRNFATVFFLTELEMLKAGKCDNEHLPSKNHEITELDKSLSIYGVD